MGVIVETRLIGQRLQALERQRAVLEDDRRRRLATSGMPAWAIEALRMAGMTADEVVELAAAPSAPEETSPSDLDRAIRAVEDHLLGHGAQSLEGLAELAEVAVIRFRRTLASPLAHASDDQAQARTLALLERLLHDLRRLSGAPLRQVS